jgi:hypothetical protein
VDEILKSQSLHPLVYTMYYIIPDTRQDDLALGFESDL